MTDYKIAPCKNKFCETCGEELVVKPLNKFDGQTGQQLAKMVCPTGKCEHEGIGSHEYGKVSVMGVWLTEPCSRCGHCLPDCIPDHMRGAPSRPARIGRATFAGIINPFRW